MLSAPSGDGCAVGEGDADGGATDAATDGAAEEGAADADPPLDVQAAMIGASAMLEPSCRSVMARSPLVRPSARGPAPRSAAMRYRHRFRRRAVHPSSER